jgi:transcriptional regulator with XRE-family HTH domain
MNERALVARSLRRIRVRQSISQEKLAADAEVDRSYLGGLERRDANPTVDLLDRIADALSVTITELSVQPTPGEATKAA